MELACDFDEQSIQEILELTESKTDKFDEPVDLLSGGLSTADFDLVDPIVVNSCDFQTYQKEDDVIGLRMGTPPADDCIVSEARVTMSPKPEPSSERSRNNLMRKPVQSSLKQSNAAAKFMSNKPQVSQQKISAGFVNGAKSQLKETSQRVNSTTTMAPSNKTQKQSVKYVPPRSNSKPTSLSSGSSTVIKNEGSSAVSQTCRVSNHGADQKRSGIVSPQQSAGKRKANPSTVIGGVAVKQEALAVPLSGRSVQPNLPNTLPTTVPPFLPLVMGKNFPVFPGMPALPIPPKKANLSRATAPGLKQPVRTSPAFTKGKTPQTPISTSANLFAPNSTATTAFDPTECKRQKKQKRLIRNRISAQLHRERKKKHVGELEKQVDELKDENKNLKNRVAQLEEKNEQLTKELEQSKHQSRTTNQQHEIGDLLDLSILGDEYLNSPLSHSSDLEEFSRIHDRFSAARKGSIVNCGGGASPLSSTTDEDCGQMFLDAATTQSYRAPSTKSSTSHLPASRVCDTNLRVGSSKVPKKRKLSATRPATAAICLATIMLTVSMFATDTSPDSLLHNGVIGSSSSHGPQAARGVHQSKSVNAHDTSDVHPKNLDPGRIPTNRLPALPNGGDGGNTLQSPPVNVPNSLPLQLYERKEIDPSDLKPSSDSSRFGRKLLSWESSGSPHSESHSSETANDNDGKSLMSSAVSALMKQKNHRGDVTPLMLQQAISGKLQPYMGDGATKASSDLAAALYREVNAVEKYLPAPPSQSESPEKRNSSEKVSSVNHKSLAVYNAHGQFRTPETESVQQQAVHAAVQAYLAHVGANIDGMPDHGSQTTDSIIMCPQAYGILTTETTEDEENVETSQGTEGEVEPGRKRPRTASSASSNGKVLEEEKLTLAAGHLRGKLIGGAGETSKSLVHHVPRAAAARSGTTGNGTQASGADGNGDDGGEGGFGSRNLAEPYLTLFVPSDAIHAPQWGLDGSRGGFVQLGCKLDTVRPLFAPSAASTPSADKGSEVEEGGFRVL